MEFKGDICRSTSHYTSTNKIYNDELRDLLLPEELQHQERLPVTIREDTKGTILLTGLREVVVNDVEDLLAALNYGSNIRQTDATAINARSSRSHAVFSLSLVQRKRRSVGTTAKKDQNRRWTISGIEDQGDEATVTISSKLHFVDLAGSERLKLFPFNCADLGIRGPWVIVPRRVFR
jgi:kinesin family protein 4/21/27